MHPEIVRVIEQQAGLALRDCYSGPRGDWSAQAIRKAMGLHNHQAPGFILYVGSAKRSAAA